MTRDKEDPCRCYLASYSQYHENCNVCRKYILTIYDKYEILERKYKRILEVAKSLDAYCDEEPYGYFTKRIEEIENE